MQNGKCKIADSRIDTYGNTSIIDGVAKKKTSNRRAPRTARRPTKIGYLQILSQLAGRISKLEDRCAQLEARVNGIEYATPVIAAVAPQAPLPSWPGSADPLPRFPEVICRHQNDVADPTVAPVIGGRSPSFRGFVSG